MFDMWKKFVFSTVAGLIFSLALQDKLCFICDSSLHIMSAEDKKSQVFSYF